MAYDRNELIKAALDVIAKEKLVFVDETFVLMGISKQTFYNHELHECPAIIDALTQNKINMKRGLRAKWYKADNPTAQIALYRLISTEDELERLSVSKHRIETVKEQPLFPDPITNTDNVPTDNGNQ